MIDKAIAQVLAIQLRNTAEVAAADHEYIGALVAAVFNDEDFHELSIDRQIAVVRQMFAIYSLTWHASGRSFVPAVERVFRACLDDPAVALDDICAIYDTLFFLYWYAEISIERQRGFLDGVATPFAAYLGDRANKDEARNSGARRIGEPIRIGYLAQFAAFGPASPMADAAFDFLSGLVHYFPKRYEPTLIAWMLHDAASTTIYERQGIKVINIAGNSTAERIGAVEAAIRAAGVDMLISDMNTALPTVIFAWRLAPVQIFYQLGMPFWSDQYLEGVFRAWSTDPQRVGFEPRKCFQMNGPWDVSALAPPVDRAAVAELRQAINGGKGLIIGSYGRVIKVSIEYLTIVEALVARRPDVTVAIGGNGDPGSVRRFIEDRDLQHRIRLFEGHVDGHVWGHVLDVFLDTFPLHGGASCREVIAKGVPVVSLQDDDMPNLSEQERVPFLVGATLAEYESIVSRLIAEPAFLEQARQETRRFAQSRPRKQDYAIAADRAIQTLKRRSSRKHIVSWLRSAVRAGRR